MTSFKSRLKELDWMLESDMICLKSLRKFCFQGIPVENGRRALCWKLLLNYLPPSRLAWDEALDGQRCAYRRFVREMVVRPGGAAGGSAAARVDVTEHDHPLSDQPNSQWQTFFKDNDVLGQIDKDVRRLCPDISFFQQPTEFPCQEVVCGDYHERLHERVQRVYLDSASVCRVGLGMQTKVDAKRRQQEHDYVALPGGQEAHWEVVERILFIYAKLNPGQSYVQGMNEIVGPIYYTFASNPDARWREHAEADTFGVFTNLMSEIRDFFIKTLDDSHSGINFRLRLLMERLHHHDPHLAVRLKVQQLYPQYFAFRWMTLLLSQEFTLPDVIRIWDSLFADEKRFDFLTEVCCAMMIQVREQLMSGDFAHNMKLLQNYPPLEIRTVLAKAEWLLSR
ncbi:TBC1 domain family member 13-like isoform X2 [Amphibalanus amphitrite]|uniref:TBC1 domain family member 13-like isoform X2 n=1 Tax=Amphibalanus amphitrite TaxID=1232801 RepID=UPI001C8FFAB9|nr:TBC1 domain family member 13-like isoform X2 [Amphibalanus amphitrite]XP_043214610.1 TBC1 domain family member 13-like isoform X2 [Amphibalanus amphitrite]XP_043214611.1 TBC1 domain family member 13-like isoform X2 [Amphibalanus amphitrite]XP_043214612.1 TBC1 domain family member 13-like isoform X2 [Amphibalanus amphitrite]XP_043214613.1 TBC1 domain family member 13-like isoform X2 [Amphibalanus amphitrite]